MITLIPTVAEASLFVLDGALKEEFVFSHIAKMLQWFVFSQTSPEQ